MEGPLDGARVSRSDARGGDAKAELKDDNQSDATHVEREHDVPLADRACATQNGGEECEDANDDEPDGR